MNNNSPWFRNRTCTSNHTTGIRSLSIRMVWDALEANQLTRLFPRGTATIIPYNKAHIKAKNELLIHLAELLSERNISTTIFIWKEGNEEFVEQEFDGGKVSALGRMRNLVLELHTARADAARVCKMIQDEHDSPSHCMQYAFVDGLDQVTDSIPHTIKLMEDLIANNNSAIGIITFYQYTHSFEGIF